MDSRPICEPIELPDSVNVLAEVVRHGPESTAPPRLAHFHSLCEIVWFRRCKGRFFAEAGPEDIGDWSAIFVPSMHMHDFELNEGIKEWVLIQFEPFLVDAIKGRLDEPLFDRSFVCLPNETERARLDMLVGWLVENCNASPEQSLSGTLIELILTVFCGAGRIKRDGESRTSRFLDRIGPAIERIHNDPGGQLSLEEAASACNLSAAYFSRSFKQIVGQNFHDYKRTYRLNLSARRLLATRAQISQIAYALGFSSPAHFSAEFRKRFGVTPRAYRDGQRALYAQKASPAL